MTARATRPMPGRDDKIVASWNGLAIRALVDAGTICKRQDWLDCATKAGDLLVSIHLGADPITQVDWFEFLAMANLDYMP
jgi:uncharacterized protein